MRRCKRKRRESDNHSNEDARARGMTEIGRITGITIVFCVLLMMVQGAAAIDLWEEEELRALSAEIPWEELIDGAAIGTRNGGVKRWIDEKEPATVPVQRTTVAHKSRRLRQAPTEAPPLPVLPNSTFYCNQTKEEMKKLVRPVDDSKDYKIHILVPLPMFDNSAVGRFHGRNPFELSISKVNPVIDFAIDYIYDQGILPRNSLEVTYRDSELSDAKGPNVAIEALKNKKLHCVIGYAFVYALAPVARMAPYWTTHTGSCGVPVITTIGNTGNLDDKSEYRLMTRIASPYKVLRLAVAEFIKLENWTKVTYLFHDYRSSGTEKDVAVPVSECFLLMASIRPYLNTYFNSLNVTQDFNYFMFNQDKWTRANYMALLRKMSEISNGEYLIN